MSLMDDYRASCVKMVQKTENDGEGGFFTKWEEGNAFPAVIALNESSETTKGERRTAANTYNVIVSKALDLNYHDVIKRLPDGMILRVTSDGTDKKTPESAFLDMRLVTAEEWALT